MIATPLLFSIVVDIGKMWMDIGYVQKYYYPKILLSNLYGCTQLRAPVVRMGTKKVIVGHVFAFGL